MFASDPTPCPGASRSSEAPAAHRLSHIERLVDSIDLPIGPQGPRWLRTSYVPDFDARRQVRGLYTVTIDVHELTMRRKNSSAAWSATRSPTC